MDQPERRFAELLTKAIYKIKQSEAKKISIIQDEIGYALEKQGGASIEHWRKGNFPTRWTELDQLARILVGRGRMDRDWLTEFLTLGRHPAAEQVVAELYPEESQPAEPNPTHFELPTDHLPDPGHLPAGSQMPLSRNRFFVGRKDDLLDLARHFQQGHVAAVGQKRVAAATGLGGVGKTQLASEFVHRYGQFFPGGVFWLSFEDPEAVPSQIAEIGGTSGMNLSPVFWELPLAEQVKLVQQAWNQPIPRLLIFDNCEDEELLAQWLPTSGGCRILLTTRRGEWDPILGVQTVSLGELYRHESVDLLQSLSRVADLKILDEIAAECGDLPLALHLAGKYLYRMRRAISPAEYLTQLQDPDLLNHPSFTQDGAGLSPTGHVQHVARTFSLSYDQLDVAQEADRLAHALLVRIAHFAPGEPIWVQLLIKTIEPLVGPDRLELKADQGFTRLIDLGLIEYEEQDQIFRMHRLVAAFVRQFAREAVEETLASIETIVFEETARINEAGHPVPLLSWNLHLRAVAEGAMDRHSEQGAWLSNSVGEHLRQRGDYRGALEYFEKALSIWQATAGESDVQTATGHLNVGRILRDLGKLEDAKPHLEQSLHLRQELLGEMHPKTAEAYNEFGRWLFSNQNLSEAKTQLQKAVDISLSTVGRMHTATADYLNNLGMIICVSGEYEKSLPFLEDALNIRKVVLGQKHPRTALSLNNMGFTLHDLGRLEEAKTFYLEAIEVREGIFGENHPETAESLNNLGFLYNDLEDFESARKSLRKVVEIYNKVYGDFHSRTIQALHNLSQAEFKTGRIEVARQTISKAYLVALNLFDKDHPLFGRVIKRMAEIDSSIESDN